MGEPDLHEGGREDAGAGRFEIGERDGVTVVAVRGELDAASEEQFRDAVSRAIDERNRPLIVDLSRCSFIDSISIGILCAAQRSLETQAHPGAPLAVVAGRFPARALKVANVDVYIPVFETLEQAMDAVRAHSPEG
jgi:anti-sigma B factor antagonist